MPGKFQEVLAKNIEMKVTDSTQNKGRIWIGDCHGHYLTAKALIKRLPKDREIGFVGDLIDRGPRPLEMLEMAFAVSDTVLMGNHEEIMMVSLMAEGQRRTMAMDTWRSMGGSGLIRMVEDYQGTDQRLIDLGQKLQIWHENENVFAIHAGAPAGFKMGDGLREWLRHDEANIRRVVNGVGAAKKSIFGGDLLWEYSEEANIDAFMETKKKIVMGHMAVLEPEISHCEAIIDCGVYKNGGRLVAWDDYSGEIWEQAPID